MTRKLDHSLPWSSRPEEAEFFITLCVNERGSNTLCRTGIGDAILESVRWRNVTKRWWCSLVVIMPDHLHLIANFPPEADMEKAIREWKSWLARSQKIEWQRDFFDHRLRGDESGEEKYQYILNNPVRTGLVGKVEDWPWQWRPSA